MAKRTARASRPKSRKSTRKPAARKPAARKAAPKPRKHPARKPRTPGTAARKSAPRGRPAGKRPARKTTRRPSTPKKAIVRVPAPTAPRAFAHRRPLGPLPEVKHHDIADETDILPEIVAESVVDSVTTYLYYAGGKTAEAEQFNAERERLVEGLVGYAERVYDHNESFRKKLRSRGNRGRDTLYSFMRHWLSAEIKIGMPNIARLIPASFANGEPLPREFAQGWQRTLANI
jgi:hypothetical protein